VTRIISVLGLMRFRLQTVNTVLSRLLLLVPFSK